VNPKSLNAAIFFIAVHAREMQRDLDGPVVDIVLAIVRAMRTMNAASYVGSRIQPQALAQMNACPFDEIVGQVNRILCALEDGTLTSDATYGIYADFYHAFIDAPVYAEVAR
jgi:hypothetical protein